MEYGTFKGSGTFGDAIYLKKKVIIPTHVDPSCEFEEIALFYHDISGLSVLFNSLNDLINVEIRVDFYNKFSSTSVFNSVKSLIIKNGMCG
jgi:hypothetical protein